MSRPMTAAEKYYAFLDQAWPMNLTVVAQLERELEPDWVENRWTAFARMRVLTRTMPTPDLTLVDGGVGVLDFSAKPLGRGGLPAALAEEADIQHGLERGVLCRLWTVPGENRCYVGLVGHHSVVDARGGMTELQQFIRFLDGHEVLPQHQLSAPSPGPAYPWQTDRGALIALLRALGARNEALGPPEPTGWLPADVARTPRFHVLVQPEEQTASLLRAASRRASRPFPSLAAAAMLSVADAIGGSRDCVLQLNVPVDLAADRGRLDRPVAVNVGVVSQRHLVRTDGAWSLARAVAGTLAESLARGEGELFFHLARVERIDDMARGVRVVRDGVGHASPAVSVTNLGIIASDRDPPWLSGLYAYQASTPNQVVAVLGLGYRGRMFTTMSTDDERVPPGVSEDLAVGYGGRLEGMAELTGQGAQDP